MFVCEVGKNVEFRTDENPKGIAGNKCALEQVQTARPQLELALRRIYYLLYLSGFLRVETLPCSPHKLDAMEFRPNCCGLYYE